MIRALVVATLLAAASPALAQQPDAATMQKAVSIIQAQRNQALDAQVGAEIRASTLADENAKLKARVQELEARLPKDATPTPP